MASASSRDTTGYLPVDSYGMIGNMRTCALVSTDGSVDFMCWPDFDSPSIFCRLLDKDKGGYFSIAPSGPAPFTTKQQYMPSSAILQTRYIQEEGVVDVVDFFPRPKSTKVPVESYAHSAFKETQVINEQLKQWLVRRVVCIRGQLELDVQIFPAFDYACEGHSTRISQPVHKIGTGDSRVATFRSGQRWLQLDVVIDNNGHGSPNGPTIVFKKETRDQMLGDGVTTTLSLTEGQSVAFVLRNDTRMNDTPETITTEFLNSQQHATQTFWFDWLSKSQYKGMWRELANRSLMILKMLTYEPTGAIVAAPTFSIPEYIGGSRNWDYRFSWVRDSSFTIYILLRLGFTEEADAYMQFIDQRFKKSLTESGDLPIMFTIRGETDIPEETLDHLDGYRGSKPVRIGNGAAFHQQLDIYGELMDTIYLYNKYGKPISWDTWVAVRKMLDHVLTLVDRKFELEQPFDYAVMSVKKRSPLTSFSEPDMSIWEVRNNKQHFVYSKIMMWVAFDRGLRLAEKRCLPCPNRAKWLETRDNLYEEIMEKGYNKDLDCFIQSYENNTMLDSSILIAPLVFFITPSDPRFLKTMDRILKPLEQGGLTSAGMVYRYDTNLSEDGVGGDEGAFSSKHIHSLIQGISSHRNLKEDNPHVCTFWLVEALTRASKYEPKYYVRAVNLFENMLGFSNHLHMFSEEISSSGKQLGNTPQAFSHLALISAAFNLDRASEFKRA